MGGRGDGGGCIGGIVEAAAGADVAAGGAADAGGAAGGDGGGRGWAWRGWGASFLLLPEALAQLEERTGQGTGGELGTALPPGLRLL